ISNLKFVETDMIPFFLLATQSRINDNILAPYNSTAPQIDYSDSEFSLIDNINITETQFQTVENPVIQVNNNGGFVVITSQSPASTIGNLVPISLPPPPSSGGD